LPRSGERSKAVMMGVMGRYRKTRRRYWQKAFVAAKFGGQGAHASAYITPRKRPKGLPACPHAVENLWVPVLQGGAFLRAFYFYMLPSRVPISCGRVEF